MDRTKSFMIIGLHYLIAVALGWLVCHLTWDVWPHLASLFVADVVATIYIWILGLIYRNVSFYDPYWSVAPPVMMTWYFAVCGAFTLPALLLLVAVWYWAIRLTANWAITFKGMAHEDWRYTKYRALGPLAFHFINFTGLNMVPTLVVFMAMVPGFDLIARPCEATPLTFVALAICVAAATIQLISDTQSHRFRAEHPGEVCNVGLWKHGRHPNYFGEITMWWGVWLFHVASFGVLSNPWLVIGPISVTVLFCTVSIPLMESRQLKNKPGYAAYRRSTRLFI